MKYLRLGLIRLGHVRMTLNMSPCMQWDHRHQGRLSYSIIYSTTKLMAVPKGGANLYQTPEQKRLRPQNCKTLQKQTAMVFSSSTKPRANLLAIPKNEVSHASPEFSAKPKSSNSGPHHHDQQDLAQEPTRLSCVYCMTKGDDHQPERRLAWASAAGSGSGRNGCAAGGLALPGAGCARAGCAAAANATSIACI